MRVLSRLCFVCLLLLPGVCPAAYVMRQFHVANSGLQSNAVYKITETEDGYLYFATDRGICRYNGTGIELVNLGAFTYETYLNIVCQEKKTLWFLPFRSPLIRYQQGKATVSGAITFAPSKVFRSYFFGFGSAGGKLHFLIRDTMAHFAFTGNGNQVSRSSTYSFYAGFIRDRLQSKSAGMLARMQDSLHSFMAQSMGFRDLRIYNDRYFIARNLVYDLDLDQDPLLLDLKQSGIPGFATAVLYDSDRLWISVVGQQGGIYQFRKNVTGRYVLYEQSYQGDDVSDIIKDRYGNIWFSTLNKGIFKIRNCDRYVRYLATPEQQTFTNWKLLGNGNQLVAADNKSSLWLINWPAMQFKKIFSNEKVGVSNKCELIMDKKTNHLRFISIYEQLIDLDAGAHILKISGIKGKDIFFTKGMKFSQGYGNDIYMSNGIDVFHIDYSLGTVKNIYTAADKPVSVCNIQDSIALMNTGKVIWRLQQHRMVPYYTPSLASGEYMHFTGEGNGGIVMACGGKLYYADPQGQGALRHLYSMPDNKFILAALPYRQGYRQGYICIVKNGFICIGNEGQLLGEYSIAEQLLQNEIQLYALSQDDLFLSDGRLIFKIPVNDVLSGKSKPVMIGRSVRINDHRINYSNDIRLSYRDNQTLMLEYDLFEADEVGQNVLYNVRNSRGAVVIKGVADGKSILLNNLTPDRYTLQVSVLWHGVDTILSSRAITIVPLWYQRRIWQLVLCLVLLALLSMLIWKRWQFFYSRKMKKIILQERLLRLESKSRLNQLKPHFIFNALIPIQNYILMGNEEKALDYLNDYSRLMRNMLEISGQDMISLEEEIGFLNKYLKVQQAQHSGAFDYQISSSVKGQVSLPALMVQPLVENAVVHGISDIRKGGYINIVIREEGAYMTIEVRNNLREGVSPSPPVLKNGHALQIIQERILLMNAGDAPASGLFFRQEAREFIARIVFRIK